MSNPLSTPFMKKVFKISFLTKKTIYQKREVLFHLKNHKLVLLGSFLLLGIVSLALIGPFLSPYSYDATNLVQKNSSPSLSHIFGTDDLGRDLFTRSSFGARISLFVGISAAIIDLFIGALWGALSALSPKKGDELLMRICDILNTLPHLLVVILLLMLIGPGLSSIILALTITGWITMARIVRSQILQLKNADYILAAKALGASPTRILFHHLLPNAMGPILVTLTLTIPSAIFSEAFLSFIGLGVQAPIASWGVMVNDGLSAMTYYPWRLFVPATLITVTILGFHLLGEGFRDILDPKGEL
jgi:oligopeptide transport system permease protein